MSSGNTKMYLGLHVKCPTILSDFNKIYVFSIDFHKFYQISVTSDQRKPRRYMRPDICGQIYAARWADMTKVVGDFRGYADAKKKKKRKPAREIKVYKHEVYKLFRYVRTKIYFPTSFILPDDVPII